MTVQEYLVWFDEVVEPTDRMIRLVPEDRLEWKPTASSFSLGQLIAHIPRSLWFSSQVMLGGDVPAKNMREILVGNRRQAAVTVQEAVTQWREFSVAFKEAVAGLGDERFQKGEHDTPQGWRYAVFALEHHIHHLMELHMGLKLLGVKVHTGTLYGTGLKRSGPPEGGEKGP